MAEVKKLSEDISIKDIALDTWEFNKGAHHFFQSQGFEIYNIQMWNIPR